MFSAASVWLLPKLVAAFAFTVAVPGVKVPSIFVVPPEVVSVP